MAKTNPGSNPPKVSDETIELINKPLEPHKKLPQILLPQSWLLQAITEVEKRSKKSNITKEIEEFKSIALASPEGVKIDAVNKKGQTFLHVAAHAGALDVVKDLIEQGADSNLKDKQGSTPFHLALIAGHRQVSMELDPNEVDIQAESYVPPIDLPAQNFDKPHKKTASEASQPRVADGTIDLMDRPLQKPRRLDKLSKKTPRSPSLPLPTFEEAMADKQRMEEEKGKLQSLELPPPPPEDIPPPPSDIYPLGPADTMPPPPPIPPAPNAVLSAKSSAALKAKEKEAQPIVNPTSHTPSLASTTPQTPAIVARSANDSEDEEEKKRKGATSPTIVIAPLYPPSSSPTPQPLAEAMPVLNHEDPSKPLVPTTSSQPQAPAKRGMLDAYYDLCQKHKTELELPDQSQVGKFPIKDEAKEFPGNLLGTMNLNGQRCTVIHFDNPEDARKFLEECEAKGLNAKQMAKDELQTSAPHCFQALEKLGTQAPKAQTHQPFNPADMQKGQNPPHTTPSHSTASSTPKVQGTGGPAGGIRSPT